MLKNIILITFLLIGSINLSAQEIADYKYIIVPAKFEFQDAKNEYQLNAFSRFLFLKYGFDAYLETEDLPADLNSSGCNTLYMEPKAEGFLSTRITFDLINCRNEIVYTSPRGTSKIKQYQEAYQDALRRAFEGFEELGYEYSEEVVKDAVAITLIKSEDKPDSENISKPKEKVEIEVAVKPTQLNTTAEKTVVVDTYTKAPTTTVTERPGAEEIKGKNVKTTATAIIKKEPDQGITIIELVSTDGSYRMKTVDETFDIYEGNVKIGTAIKTSGGSYFVNTSQFTGVGYFDGDEFTVEREIKGVEGLVKMIFKPTE